MLTYSNYAAGESRILRFSCVKFGAHSVGLHSRIIEKNWSGHLWLTFATWHFMQSSVEAAAPNVFPTLIYFSSIVFFFLSFLLVFSCTVWYLLFKHPISALVSISTNQENKSVTPEKLPQVEANRSPITNLLCDKVSPPASGYGT